MANLGVLLAAVLMPFVNYAPTPAVAAVRVLFQPRGAIVVIRTNVVGDLTGRKWTPIACGGGAYGVDDLRKLGVPESSMCAFQVYEAKCAAK